MDEKEIKERVKRAKSIQKAEFNPRIKHYVFYSGVLLLTATIVGILLIPLWIIFGKKYIHRYFENLHCELTTRALHFKKGVWFQTERTIPLDKIQDLTFKEGPLLRYFDLSTLYVETAGQSAQGAADLSLTGILEAHKFRSTVLDQRDNVTEIRSHSGESKSDLSSDARIITVLEEIRDSLKSIESRIDT